MASSPSGPGLGTESRIRGLFAGLVSGLEVTLDAAATAGELELMEVTLRRLVDPELALERMVDDWVEVSTAFRLVPDALPGLTWLARHHGPPGRGEVETAAGSLVRFLPVAVLARDSPANLVSATYHLVALLDPEPVTQWSAVAANVAAARFLRGRKDFVADAIEALRANEAPESVIDVLRRIPLEPVSALDRIDPSIPVDCMHAALWFALREPRRRVAEEWVLERHPSSWLLPLSRALGGARDGAASVTEISSTGALRVERLMTPFAAMRP